MLFSRQPNRAIVISISSPACFSVVMNFVLSALNFESNSDLFIYLFKFKPNGVLGLQSERKEKKSSWILTSFSFSCVKLLLFVVSLLCFFGKKIMFT